MEISKLEKTMFGNLFLKKKNHRFVVRETISGLSQKVRFDAPKYNIYLQVNQNYVPFHEP